MTLPLFCFGSLMDRDVLRCVVGDNESLVQMRPAFIAGYFKARLPHETYPMLVPEAEREAPGQLLYGLNKEDLDRIVFFEGEEYELSPCKVRVADNEWVDALFFDEGIMPPPETAEWDFEEWKSKYKPFMLRQTDYYMSFYGKLSAPEADVYWQNYEE